MTTSWVAWTLFHVLILGVLALDLGVFHRRSHAVSLKEALVWSGVWIALALGFNAGVYWWKGAEPALQFLTGYAIEKSLSVDNIFVFVMIFSYFRVPSEYQHKVLFWGILSALIMRAVLIALGAALLQTFHWIIYVFGGFLIFTGIKMALQRHDTMDPSKNPLLRILKRWMPMTSEFQGDQFFVKQAGRWIATP